MSEENVTKNEEIKHELVLGENKPEQNIVDIPADNIIQINVDELKPNSVLVVKINPEGMHQRIAASRQIVMALQPVIEKLREKNIIIIIMANEETIETLDEEQMSKMGWTKKDKSLIINPFDK